MKQNAFLFFCIGFNFGSLLKVHSWWCSAGVGDRGDQIQAGCSQNKHIMFCTILLTPPNTKHVVSVFHPVISFENLMVRSTTSVLAPTIQLAKRCYSVKLLWMVVTAY